jgi:hypothetical protein
LRLEAKLSTLCAAHHQIDIVRPLIHIAHSAQRHKPACPRIERRGRATTLLWLAAAPYVGDAIGLSPVGAV